MSDEVAHDTEHASGGVPEPMPAETDAPKDLSLGLTADLRELSAALGEPAEDETASPAAEPASDDAPPDVAETHAVGVREDAAAILDSIPPGTFAQADEPDADTETEPEAEAETAEVAEESAEAEEPAAAETAETEAAEIAEVAEQAAPEGEPAPEPEEVAAEELVAVPRTRVAWWPFVVYVVAWLGGAGYVVYQLRQTAMELGVYEPVLYEQSLRGALGLLAFGPALLLIVWLASWIGRKNVRIGSMFLSALVQGATATFIGALIWMGALLLLDYLRLGKPY